MLGGQLADTKVNVPENKLYISREIAEVIFPWVIWWFERKSKLWDSMGSKRVPGRKDWQTIVANSLAVHVLNLADLADSADLAVRAHQKVQFVTDRFTEHF